MKDEFIPMLEMGSEIPKIFLKTKVRPCIPKMMYGFLFMLLSSGTILLSTSFHKINNETINIVAGKGGYETKYFFELPWEYNERENVALKNKRLVMPTVVAQRGRNIAIYHNCLVAYSITDVKAFSDAIFETKGGIGNFGLDLISGATNYTEDHLSNVTVFKDQIDLTTVNPLKQFSYLTTKSFTCMKKGAQSPILVAAAAALTEAPTPTIEAVFNQIENQTLNKLII